MQQRSSAWLALAAILPWAAPAGAATTVYVDRAAWESAVAGAVLTEDFADAVLNSGVTFVSAESGHVNPALELYQDVLASTSGNLPATTWHFAPDIVAFGGTWTLGGPGGSGNSLLVYADTTTFVGSIPNSYDGEFWGFVASAPMSSLRLVGGLGTHQQNYQLD
ncbi:MAG: hypothetical protein KDK06_02000, partial [Gammaproteobacteria bacterium]|nr:hypothetical protein [Gammaproteobacteria bacterium]